MLGSAALGNCAVPRDVVASLELDGTYSDPMALFGLGGQLSDPFRCAVYNGITAGHVDILRACIELKCLRNPDGSMYTEWGYDALSGAGMEMVKLMHQHDLLPPYVGHPMERDERDLRENYCTDADVRGFR